MTARETLGLRPGERTTLDAVKAMLRLAKPLVGILVMPNNTVRAVELGDRYFDNVWRADADVEPILLLSQAEVEYFRRWCSELRDAMAKNDGRKTMTIWERLRVDFIDP